MNKSKIMVGLVGLVYILFGVFQFIGQDKIAYYLSALLLPTVTVIYFLKVKKKSLYFTLFLVIYSISDLLVFAEKVPYYANIDYYLGNALYILAYMFLLLEISKTLSLKRILKNYIIHTLVLLALSIYIIYVLQVIVDPFVSATYEYYVELIYNIMLLILLSISLLNYFCKDNVKALYLFLGVLCIVFAEVIWVAYTYISERNLLNMLSTTLYLLSYYFLYQQSKLVDESHEELAVIVD